MGAVADMKKRRAYLNRCLLEALKEFGASDVADLAAYHKFIQVDPTRDELVRGMKELLALGYVENHIPGDYEIYRITGNGMRQVMQDAPRDPAVWFGAMG